MRKSVKFNQGFTLVEVLLAVGLLALVSVVSVSIVTNLVRSSAKSQANIDIEQASNFVFLKMENDIKKSYYAQVSGSTQLILRQGSPAAYVTKTYTLKAGCNAGLACVVTNQGTGEIKLTDDTTDVDGKLHATAVSIDLLNSSFSLVTDALAKPLAVNIKITFIKPSVTGTKVFDAKSTIDTAVVLRGSYQ